MEGRKGGERKREGRKEEGENVFRRTNGEQPPTTPFAPPALRRPPTWADLSPALPLTTLATEPYDPSVRFRTRRPRLDPVLCRNLSGPVSAVIPQGVRLLDQALAAARRGTRTAARPKGNQGRDPPYQSARPRDAGGRKNEVAPRGPTRLRSCAHQRRLRRRRQPARPCPCRFKPPTPMNYVFPCTHTGRWKESVRCKERDAIRTPDHPQTL